MAPVSILGIYEDNIARVLTLYAPFYQDAQGMALGFKPSFRLAQDDGVVERTSLFSAPKLPLDELRALARRHAADDFWGRRMGQIDFPYTRALVKLLWTGLDGLEPGKPFGLWQTREGEAVMAYLVEEFRRTALQAGSRPVVLFIPHNRPMERAIPPSYTGFREQLEGSAGDLIVVDLSEHDFDRPRFHLAPYRGHASGYGNRVVAELLEKKLRAHQALESWPPGARP